MSYVCTELFIQYWCCTLIDIAAYGFGVTAGLTEGPKEHKHTASTVLDRFTVRWRTRLTRGFLLCRTYSCLSIIYYFEPVINLINHCFRPILRGMICRSANHDGT
jgi:hypothetical protein